MFSRDNVAAIRAMYVYTRNTNRMNKKWCARDRACTKLLSSSKKFAFKMYLLFHTARQFAVYP